MSGGRLLKQFNIKICFLFISIGFMILCLPRSLYATEEKPTILVLNSYHKGFVWTDEQTEGIVNKLKENNSDTVIFVEYMDWKRYHNSEDINFLYQYYKYKYSSKQLNMVITTDDAALEFAIKHKESIFNNAPIVFSGVNESGYQEIAANNKNVTGVIEDIDARTTTKIALDIIPELENLYLLYDNTESGLSSGELIAQAVKGIKADINIIRLNQYSINEQIGYIKKISGKSAIFIATYSVDKDGTYINHEEFSKHICQASAVPVFQLYDFGMGYGALGGSMLSGKLTGESVGILAVNVLNGKNIDEIIPYTVRNTHSVFDYTQIERFNININALPKDSEFINRPFSFFETYKLLVYAVLSIISILSIFIVILYVYSRRILKMKNKLYENNEELTQIYEELAASEEELRMQLDEMEIVQNNLISSEKKLQSIAYFDTLTQLPNRFCLSEELENITQVATNKNIAVLFVDMDNFKNINDTLGHFSGDQLLKKMANRINSLVNQYGKVYRLGGDEFIILIEDFDETQRIFNTANDIVDKLKEPFEIEDSYIYITVSIGIALSPEHGKSADELLKNADIAMYNAKSIGKNTYAVFDESLKNTIMKRMEIEEQMRNALDNKEFMLYYQPQIDIQTGKISGFEALLRWNNTKLGFIPPDQFIPIAEDNHTIIPLGQWVLKEACHFIKTIHCLGYKDMNISVNVSIRQLLQQNFLNIVKQTLKDVGLSSKFLEIEITESVLMESYEIVCKKLEYLYDMGVSIALDDFGKGYSSLTYLKDLPISTLKIDKSFVDDVLMDGYNKALTELIISIAQKMQLNIVAEGVEVTEQLAFLKQKKCDKFQGYLFSRPIPENEIINLLKTVQ